VESAGKLTRGRSFAISWRVSSTCCAALMRLECPAAGGKLGYVSARWTLGAARITLGASGTYA
jgi:hypothetical protein